MESLCSLLVRSFSYNGITLQFLKRDIVNSSMSFKMKKGDIVSSMNT